MRKQTPSSIKAFQKVLNEKKCFACLIENPVDLFYLTNLHVSEGSLIVTPTHAKLFVDGRYAEAAKRNGALPVGKRTSKALSAYLASKQIGRLAFDSAKASYQRVLELKKWTQVTPWDRPLKTVRCFKNSEEIGKLKASAKLLWRGLEEIKRVLKVGVREKEVAKHFELFCLQEGAERLGFDPIIAFGPNSALPHHRSTDRRLKRGEPALIDIGVAVEGYHSDMTRVLFLGKPSPKMQAIYEIVHRAQKEALALCAPHVKLKRLDEAVRSLFYKEGVLKYYPHSLGHGVGLEVHEYPRVSFNGADKEVQIAPSMVFTVEPGLYIPGVGGVRYEDENLYPNVELADAIL